MAKMAKKGTLAVDLSLDYYHEQINEKVEILPEIRKEEQIKNDF